jgi:hypothetical protein
MWTCVTVVYLVPAAILVNRLLAPWSFRETVSVQSKLRGSAIPQRDPRSVEVV